MKLIGGRSSKNWWGCRERKNPGHLECGW
jgi:hypothetical protein